MWKTIKKSPNEQGLTLIEVLASLVIISIVLISFSSILIQATKHTKYNKEKLTEVDIAEELVGDIRAGLNIPADGFTREITDLSPGFIATAECKERLTEILDDTQKDLGLTRIEVEVISKDIGQKKSSFKTELYMDGVCR